MEAKGKFPKPSAPMMQGQKEMDLGLIGLEKQLSTEGGGEVNWRLKECECERLSTGCRTSVYIDITSNDAD